MEVKKCSTNEVLKFENTTIRSTTIVAGFNISGMLEPIDSNVFELTIAQINDDATRDEIVYVLTTPMLQCFFEMIKYVLPTS